MTRTRDDVSAYFYTLSRDKDLRAPAKLVGAMLARRCLSNPGQLIGELPVRLQPSHAQLAAETSLSRRTVIDALESLRVRGYVTWISGARDSRRNLYTLHIPDAAAVVVPLRPRRRTAVEDQTKAQVR